jgi:hypothetical protein
MDKQDFEQEWRRRWIDLIFDLTTIEYQRKAWLDTTGTYTSPYFSYVEFICSYFDDLLVDSYQSCINEGLVTEEEFAIIQDWHELLNNYKSPDSNDWNSQAVLNDPKWVEIVAIGKQARKQLERVLPLKEVEQIKEREGIIA